MQPRDPLRSRLSVYYDSNYLHTVCSTEKANNLNSSYKRLLSKYEGTWSGNVYMVLTKSVKDSYLLAKDIVKYIAQEMKNFVIKAPFKVCVCSYLEVNIPIGVIMNTHRLVCDDFSIYTTIKIDTSENQLLVPIRYIQDEQLLTVYGYFIHDKVPKYVIVTDEIPNKGTHTLDLAIDDWAVAISCVNKIEKISDTSAIVTTLQDDISNSEVVRHAISLFNITKAQGYLYSVSPSIQGYNVVNTRESTLVLNNQVYCTSKCKSTVSPLVAIDKPKMLHAVLEPLPKLECSIYSLLKGI